MTSTKSTVKVYHGPSEKSNLTVWLVDNYHGLVGLRTPHNHHQFRAPVVHVYYEYDFGINHKTSHYWRNRIMEVAKHFRNKIRFSFSKVK